MLSKSVKAKDPTRKSLNGRSQAEVAKRKSPSEESQVKYLKRNYLMTVAKRSPLAKESQAETRKPKILSKRYQAKVPKRTFYQAIDPKLKLPSESPQIKVSKRQLQAKASTLKCSTEKG